MVEYIKARAVQIDEGTGLVNVVVYFVQRAIDNGFEVIFESSFADL